MKWHVLRPSEKICCIMNSTILRSSSLICSFSISSFQMTLRVGDWFSSAPSWDGVPAFSGVPAWFLLRPLSLSTSTKNQTIKMLSVLHHEPGVLEAKSMMSYVIFPARYSEKSSKKIVNWIIHWVMHWICYSCVEIKSHNRDLNL